ncbi:mannan-binding lectin serine protease 2 isoform X1 [Xiphophorus couchianus]|uniref:mannan-binding lectin serine protease 2 isoform X1 n=2 Tax=Xiphophorus couchianus TaxID=32473 RepID=UPI001016AD9E|nr:mannan-binding lectin serine protease 2-like isoform X1 [Xiphophorus couchianus]
MFRLSLFLLLLPCSSYSTLLGWMESPGYPRGYLPHKSLNWTKCAPKGQTVSIRLIHLDLENSQDCENDAVKISSKGNLIALLCGKRDYKELQETVNPLLFSSPGGCLTLLFHSDYSNTERHTGFRGFYTLQDFNECEDEQINKCSHFCHNFLGGYHCSCRHGYQLDEDKHTCMVGCAEDLSGLKRGDISSLSWPGAYAENTNCKYTLSVEDNLQLELHFSEGFDVEQSPEGDCIDELRIETHSETLGPFCGNKPPPSPFLTHSSHVQIHFISDGSGTNKGFNIHFKTRDKVCRPVTSNSNVTPLKQEYHRGESVTVTCDLGYVADSPDGLTRHYGTTCQSNGAWAPRYACEIVDCGWPDLGRDSILQMVNPEDQNTKYGSRMQFYCTSKFYTLEGNDTSTCNADGEWTRMPNCNEVCGMPETSSTARILGGKVATLGEVPWQLFITRPKFGAASLINDQWAVTAAHVVNDIPRESIQLYGGLIDTTTTSRTDVSPIPIEKIIVHPSYRGALPQTNYDNDIALIKFTSKVKLGTNLLPICLPEVNGGMMEGEQGTVSGWGATFQDSNWNSTSDVLQYVDVPVYSLTECRNTPSLYSKAMTFTNNMFCAGGKGADSCRGDSGGPFVSPMLSSGVGPHYLIGIVSWGAPCMRGGATGDKKGYYTKVENYVNWINEIKKNEAGS